MSIEFHAFASGSSGNCYLVVDGQSKLLIDPGITYKRIQVALDFKVSSLQGALISHGHLDHCEGAGKLMEAGINCYASVETWARGVKGAVEHRSKSLSPRWNHQIGDWTVIPFEVPHDIHTLGFLITVPSGESLVYVTDAMFVPVNFSEIPNIKILAIEANHDTDTLLANKRSGEIDPARFARVISTHASIDTVLGFFRANQQAFRSVERIYLLHLSRDNANPADFKRQVEAVIGRPVHIAAARSEVTA